MKMTALYGTDFYRVARSIKIALDREGLLD